MKISKFISRALISAALVLSSSLVFAQAPSGSLHGQVTDQSGAVVTQADVALTPATGTPVSTKTDAQGMYEFKGRAAGEYTLDVVAPGFTLYENTKVEIATQALRLNVSLAIEVQTQKVQVTDTAPTDDVNPASNAGAITISSKELEALPDDPDELLTDLQALAGPSAGPNGGQMYIDGFTAGQLPPKSSIREIRINQNPFSAEYDKLGYGRIEIFTKPGTDQLHGQFTLIGNDSAFNTRSPFLGTARLPGYDTIQFNGDLSGPLSKKASFTLDGQYRDINNVAVVSAQLEPLPAPLFTEAVSNPRTRINFSPRLDYQLSTNNTLTVRYQYYRDNQVNDAVGQYTLTSEGYTLLTTEQTLQVSDTQVFGSKI